MQRLMEAAQGRSELVLTPELPGLFCLQFTVQVNTENEMKPPTGKPISMHLDFRTTPHDKSGNPRPREQLQRAMGVLEDTADGEVDFSLEQGSIFTKVGSVPPMRMEQAEEVVRDLRYAFSGVGGAGVANACLEAYRAGWAASPEERKWDKRNHYHLVLDNPEKQITVKEHMPTEEQAVLIEQLMSPVRVEMLQMEEEV